MNIFDTLYPHQNEVVKVTSQDDKGIICMPTGTGKTYCQAAMIAQDIITNPNQYGLYVVNAPRILLTYQLLKEIYGFLLKAGIEARYMFVHTGGKTDEAELEEMRLEANVMGHDIPFSEIESGTSVDGIEEMMEKAQRQSLPLVIFSTYNSAQNIEWANDRFEYPMPISMVMNDEAHYLVQERFHDILNVLTTDRCYFFTATTIHTPSDNGLGMNNTEMYGETLYLMTPRQAIELGLMVRPRLHIVTTKGIYDSDDYNKSLNKIIADGFRQHQEFLIKTNPKILVSTKGTQDMINFLDSPEYNTLKANDVVIYAVSSNPDIGSRINEEQVRRPEFLKRLREDGSNPDKKLIVLHYDILAEGIDVSGFTGIMPLRTLRKAKFLQTYGRAARLDEEDRKVIKSGRISPNDLGMMNKPYSYIIIPNIIHTNEDDKENFAQLIRELRSFGFKPYEDIVTDSYIHGTKVKEELDGLNTPATRLSQEGRIIKELVAIFEAEDEAKLSMIDLIKKQSVEL